jgi:hypothetical protein
MAILTSGAIQCFEQPHRFAASNGFRRRRGNWPRGLPLVFVNELRTLFPWRWTAAIHCAAEKRASYAPSRALASAALPNSAYRVI